MTLLALPGRASRGRFSSRASRLGRLKAPPSKVRAPAASVSRRVSPSQQRRGLPSMVIIEIPPWIGSGRGDPTLEYARGGRLATREWDTDDADATDQRGSDTRIIWSLIRLDPS